MRTGMHSDSNMIDDLRLTAQVELFLRRECLMLDTGRYDEWVALFDPEHGEYWVPCAFNETRPSKLAPSLARDDVTRLKLRIGELRSGARWSNSPIRHKLRTLSNVTAQESAEHIDARAVLVIYESSDGGIEQYQAVAEYRLRREQESFRILAKTLRVLGVENGIGAVGDFL